MSFIETCRKFISIDSSQSSGVNELVAYAVSLAEDAGLMVETQSDVRDGKEEKNIIIRPSQESCNDELLLQTHLDTPDPGIHALWTKTQSNPFNTSIYADEIYGLGVADCKLDFLCKLEALKRLKKKNFKIMPILVGTYGHQVGMLGVKKFLRQRGSAPHLALVGAPTGLNFINATYGYVKVEISIPFTDEEIEYHQSHDLMLSSTTQSKIFYGKSANSSHPKLGENAIIHMLEHIAQLPQGIAIMDVDGGVSFKSVPESAVLELDVVGEFKEKTIGYKLKNILNVIKAVEADFVNYRSEGFDPSVSTLNIGKIKKHRDHIKLMGNCHITPAVTQEVYEGWIKSLKESCKEVDANFRVLEYKKPFYCDEESEILKLAKSVNERVGTQAEIKKSAEVTEASVLSRAGVNCLVYGPGVGAGNSYEPNEKVLISELEKATDFYTEFVRSYCL